MAYEESIRSISLVADSSLAVYTGVPGLPGSASPNSGKQYRFVKVTGDRQVGLVTANTDRAIGVLQSKPQNTGMASTVAIRGVSYVVSGAGSGSNAVTAGAAVTSDSEGRAIKLPGTGTPVAYGVALAGSTTAGELIPVLIQG